MRSKVCEIETELSRCFSPNAMTKFIEGLYQWWGKCQHEEITYIESFLT